MYLTFLRPSQILSKLRTAPPVRRLIAGALLAASIAYVRAARVVAGTSLQYAVTPRPFLALLVSVLVAAVLKPLHQLASKLVFGKVCG